MDKILTLCPVQTHEYRVGILWVANGWVERMRLHCSKQLIWNQMFLISHINVFLQNVQPSFKVWFSSGRGFLLATLTLTVISLKRDIGFSDRPLMLLIHFCRTPAPALVSRTRKSPACLTSQLNTVSSTSWLACFSLNWQQHWMQTARGEYPNLQILKWDQVTLLLLARP